MSSSGKNVGSRVYLKRASPKPQVTNAGVLEAVQKIIEDVRSRGEAGAQHYATKFDKWAGNVLMTDADIAAAVARVPETTRNDIKFAYTQISTFAAVQRKAVNDSHTTMPSGVVAGAKVMPVSCAGCYVPGGRYAHVASALMTVATAKAAGVPVVVASSPPADQRGIHAAVVYALTVAGADHILCLGGAQAMASMAFGLFTGHRADVLVGPGNRFIVAAKRILFGEVGIDMIAGPTEACVLADSTADPLIVATDLVSQGEHGPDSPCVLITTDRTVGERVAALVPQLITKLPDTARKTATISWRDYGEVIVVDTREECAAVSDEVASEHLEVHCADLDWWHATLKNYGSLFLGEETCVSFGDKTSGPNHVLPTRNVARYSGGLNVSMFMKTVTYQRMNKASLRTLAPVAARISRAEGMEAHARSSDVRLAKYFPGESFDIHPPALRASL